MDPSARIMVKVLKFNKTSNEKKHNKTTYINASFIETFFEAMGLSFVLETFLSNSLS
jgi:hypothetical protein